MKWEIIIIILALLVLMWNPQVKYDPTLAIKPDFVLTAVGETSADYFNKLSAEDQNKINQGIYDPY